MCLWPDTLPRPSRPRLTLRQRTSRYFWASQRNYTAENCEWLSLMPLSLKSPAALTDKYQFSGLSVCCKLQNKKSAVFIRMGNGIKQRLFLSLRDEISQTYVFTSLPPVIWIYLAGNTCLGQILKNTQTETPPQLSLKIFCILWKPAPRLYNHNDNMAVVKRM